MAKKSNRDNFTETTRRQLWERAGSRCSNPNCKVLTSAPNNDSLDKSARIGHGAHITAASSDGPRYDKSLTSDQRKHYDNGIWCCYNCGHQIDTEFKTFTVEQLRQWKKDAEQSISMGLNKPYYTELEHLEETQKQIRTLLAPSGASTDLLEKTTQNILQSYTQKLESLDPRLKFQATIKSNGSQSIEAFATENIPLSFEFSSDLENKENFKQLLETGETTTLKITSANFHSDALKFLMKNVKFEEVTICSAEQRVFYLSLFFEGIKIPNTITMLSTFGTKYMRFEGYLFEKIVTFILLIPLNFDEKNIDFELNFDFKQWGKRNVSDLKNFEQIHTFLNKFHKANFNIEILLSFDEKEVLSGSSKVNIQELYEFISLVNYTHLARVISNKLNQTIIFDETVSFTNDEYTVVHDAYDYATNFCRELKGTDIITATFEKDKIDKTAFSPNTSQYFELREDSVREIKIFNTIIVLPKTKISFSSVIPHLTSKKDKEIVKFRPSDKCIMTYSFQ